MLYEIAGENVSLGSHVVRVFLPNKRRRVAIAIAGQDMMDLEEVVGRNVEDLNERVLNRLRQLRDAWAVGTDLLAGGLWRAAWLGFLVKVERGRRTVGPTRWAAILALLKGQIPAFLRPEENIAGI